MPEDVAMMGGEEEDEELEDVPLEEKQADPLFQKRVKVVVNGVDCYGKVEDIEVGKVSREMLYRIRYDDNDLEHFTADKVRESLVKEDVKKKPAAAKAVEAPPAEEPVAKKPAAAEEEEEAEEEEDAGEVEEPVAKKPAAAVVAKKPAAAEEEADAEEDEEDEEDEDEEEEEEEEEEERREGGRARAYGVSRRSLMCKEAGLPGTALDPGAANRPSG